MDAFSQVEELLGGMLAERRRKAMEALSNPKLDWDNTCLVRGGLAELAVMEKAVHDLLTNMRMGSNV